MDLTRDPLLARRMQVPSHGPTLTIKYAVYVCRSVRSCPGTTVHCSARAGPQVGSRVVTTVCIGIFPSDTIHRLQKPSIQRYLTSQEDGVPTAIGFARCTHMHVCKHRTTAKVTNKIQDTARKDRSTLTLH